MKKARRLLAGDVGGTKTLLSLVEVQDGALIPIIEKQYHSKDYSDLSSLVNEFIESSKSKPLIGVIGIPGPVKNGKASLANLSWNIDCGQIRQNTGISHICLINDLVAMAYAIPELNKNEVVNLLPGKLVAKPERFAVLAPGTGLGQALLIKHGEKKIVVPSEGGHIEFAPSNETEVLLWQYLHGKFKHVSYERVISGGGIPMVFDFVVEVLKKQPLPETLERMKTQHKSRVITSMALQQVDSACALTMNIFASVLGAFAGSLALTYLIDGGIFLGGGIPFNILPILQKDNFQQGFLNKGRMHELVKNIPVNVINNNRAALKGAEMMAMELLSNKIKDE